MIKNTVLIYLIPVILVVGLFTYDSSPSTAQSPTIRLLSSSVISKFPSGFQINASVESEFNVKSIAIRLRVGQQTRGAYEYLEFNEGTNVEAELFWRTSTSSRYIPPGTIITYNFEITNINDERIDTKTEQFILEDARFEWEEITSTNVSVAYHGPVKTRAEKILSAITDTIAIMAPVLGAGTNEPIRVTMYNNVKEMLEALPPGSSTIRSELVTEGQAFTSVGTLLVLGGGRMSRGTASHEVMHILTHRAGDSIFARVPSWLDEGLAELGNIEPGFSYDIALDFAINADRLMPITSMPVLPGDPEDVIIFYGQARSLVRYMIQTWGTTAMKDLLALLKSGTNIDTALTQIYGGDRLILENNWRKAIYAPEYVPPEKGSSKPTPIPRKKILAFSLTPQADANTVGSQADPSDSSIPKVTPDSEDAITKEQSYSVNEVDLTGGSCNRSTNNKIDTSSIAIGFILVGLGLRKRMRP